jgi:CheY-like chemotaxis protein
MINISEKYRFKALASEVFARDATDSAIRDAWSEIAIAWHTLANRVAQESGTVPHHHWNQMAPPPSYHGRWSRLTGGGAMCAKCVEIDKTIQRYRLILLSVSDQITIDRTKDLIADLQTQKSALHPEQAQWGMGLENLLVILVVEDDPLIQSVVEESLTDGGFEIVIASSGESAVELLDVANGKYRALVTDINLGRDNIDGWDVARHAREIDPNFPVIYMSGKDADDWASQGVPNSIMLAKPFAPAQLVTAVSQLLNASPPPAPTA